MKISSHVAVKFAGIAAAALLLLTLTRTAAYLFYFDGAVGYFNSALLSSLLYIVPLLICAAAIVLVYLRTPALPKKKKDKTLTPQQRREQKVAAKAIEKQEKKQIAALKRAGVKLPPDPMPYFSPALSRRQSKVATVLNWICAAAFVVVAALDLVTWLHSGELLFQARWIVAIVAAVAFLIPLFGHRLSQLACHLHIAPLAWCLLCVATDYFDWDVPMNSPTKVYAQVTLCIVALYLNANVRFFVTDTVYRHRAVCAAAAAIFGISYGFPGLCTLALGIHNAAAIPSFIISLAVGAHALYALLSLLRGEIPQYTIPPKQPLPPLPADQNATSH